QRTYACSAGRKNDLRVKCDQFRDVFANAVGVTSAPADVDSKIASVAPPQLLQYLHECDGPGHSFRVVGRQSAEHANAPNALRLLRPRREQRGQRRERCPTKQRDELAPFQWLMSPLQTGRYHTSRVCKTYCTAGFRSVLCPRRLVCAAA